MAEKKSSQFSDNVPKYIQYIKSCYGKFQYWDKWPKCLSEKETVLTSASVQVAADGKRLQVIVCSATLHSFDVKKLAEKIMHFPIWVDLKVRLSYSCRSLVNPFAKKSRGVLLECLLRQIQLSATFPSKKISLTANIFSVRMQSHSHVDAQLAQRFQR